MDNSTIDRRQALLVLGGVLGAATLAGCGGGGSGSAAAAALTGTATGTGTTTTTTGTTTTGTTTSGTGKAETPEGEIGPYFTDDSASGYNRSNILSNLDGSSTQTGVPLTLKLYVYDFKNNNAPMSGCQVDIWHCNAYGIYSNEAVENTLGQTWLRGYQATDANGLVTFQTIFPGWYEGRVTHIHLRVRSKYSTASSTSDGTNTTQLFFSQTIIDSVYKSVAPYSTHGLNSTTNANDHVYEVETEGETELTLSGDATSGYTATFGIYLPITAA